MICLLAALSWYGRLLHKGLTLVLRGQVAAVNAQVVGQLAEFIDSLGLEQIQPGSDDWQRLQSLVEHMQLPNDGSISIVDRKSGATIGDLRASDASRQSLSRADLERVESQLGQLPQDVTIGGWVALADGTHYFTMRDISQPGILLIAEQREAGIWATVDYVCAPLWSFGVFVAVVLVMLGTIVSMGIIHRYENTLEDINAHLEKTIAQRSRALVNTRDAVIFGLAKLAESRDADTGEHLDRVHEYIALLARQLGKINPDINEGYIERLKIASSLHDIGKVGIRDEILLKPGKLTHEERKIMQTHGVIGARCLSAIQQRLGDDDFLDMACEIASAHHERWDGLGYPYGLEAAEIPLSARIVAVVDVYDALTTHRVYRAALSHAEATKLIVAGAGTQFDPDVVAAFEACAGEIQCIAETFTATPSTDRAPRTIDDMFPAELTV